MCKQNQNICLKISRILALLDLFIFKLTMNVVIKIILPGNCKTIEMGTIKEHHLLRNIAVIIGILFRRVNKAERTEHILLTALH